MPYIYKVKLVTVVEGDPEGSLFNSYNTEVEGKGATPFPCSAPLYPLYVSLLLSVKQGSTIF